MGRYLAFISYRHRDRDQLISGLFRKGLETHALPRELAAGGRRVFRDTDELPTSSDLGTDIEDALAESGWLIALCSDEYVQSRWCMREIDEYISLGRKDRILPVLTGGSAETAVPDPLRDLPLAADLRDVPDRALSGAVKKVIPSLLSRMYGAEEAAITAARRNRRIAVCSGLLALLSAVSVGFALYAVRTAAVISGKNTEIAAAVLEAGQEKAEALAQRNSALKKRSDYYAGEAEKALLAGEETFAVEQALEALPREPDEPASYRAVNVLRQVLNIPAMPKEGYEKTVRIEPGFPVRTAPVYWESDTVTFFSGQDPESVWKYSFSAGEMTREPCTAQREAEAEGFARGYQVAHQYENRIYYGRDRQMRQVVGNDVTSRNFTLNGEPFFADRLWQSPDGFFLLASLEEPAEGQEARTALFAVDNNKGRSAAVAELDVSGKILSVSWRNHRLAVVEEGGRLRLFDLSTGECRGEAEGAWSFVHYAYTTNGLFAASRDGRGVLLDPVTLEEVYTLESPAPVRQIWYCHARKQLLACCSDGFRVYRYSDGSLVTAVVTEEEPRAVYWGGFDEWSFPHSGGSVLVLYGESADFYSVTVKNDEKVSDAVTLYAPGIQTGCRTVLFSADSRYVYTEGGRGSLYKWDAETGALLWRNEHSWTTQASAHCRAFLSRDGKTIWRGNDDMNGYHCVDTETGETLRSVDVTGRSFSVRAALESPDGTRMIAQHEYGGRFCVFDPAAGEILWEGEGSEELFFSPDGREICNVRLSLNNRAWTKDCVWQRLETETGKLLEETLLLSLDQEEYIAALDVSPENRLIVVSGYRKEDPGTRFFWRFDMDSRILREYRIAGEAAYVYYPYSGGSSAEWKDEYLYRVCMLNPDGTTGPAEDLDSEAGRRMTTSGEQYVMVAEDECRETSDGSAYSVIRLEDGEPLFRPFRAGKINGVLSPDGKTVCVFANDLLPALIRLTDDSALIEKAKAWLEGGQ